MTWKPDLSTREEVGGFVQDLLAVLPDQLGIDEVVAGCEVLVIPAGAPPKYIYVALGGDAGPPQTGYTQAVLYRGGITGLAVGDYVTVIHLREGNRYEVLGPGGAAGAVIDPAPVNAEYVVMSLDATLTDERVLTAGDGIGLVDGGAGGNATLSVDCTDLLGAWIGEDAANNLRFQPDNPVVVSAGGVIVEYATIQAAITAAAACETVLVPPGTYAEDITLKNGVCVKGFGPRDKIRITGDEDIVTTAAGGWLENVTIVATDPPAAGMRQVVDFAHAAGTCRLREVTISVSSTVNAQLMHAINSTGAGSGLLVLDDIEIDVSTTQAGSVATGIRVDDSYKLDLKNFKIVVANTGAGAGDDAYGIIQIASAVVKATEGWLDVTATGAGTATDLSGTIIYSEIVTTDNCTIFGNKVGLIGMTAPEAELSFTATASNTVHKLRWQSQINTTDAAVSTLDHANGVYIIFGANCYINAAGGLARYNAGEESSYIGVQPTGVVDFGTGNNAGIAVSRMTISVTGTVTMSSYGAGDTQFLAGGVITSVSDKSVKRDIRDTEIGLAEVLQMRGKHWRFTEASGLNDENNTEYQGFIADDIEKIVPGAVGRDAEGLRTMGYSSLMPAFAEAFREIDMRLGKMEMAQNIRGTM